jgi:outer membrane protein TolC
VTLTQALLQGFGTDVNLATLRQARLDTRISEYELRAFVEQLIASVEETYWDYALAQRQIEIFTNSLAVAERQLDQTRQMVRVGKLASIDLAASEAEVALRREDLINARATLDIRRLQLLRLVNPPNGSWDREIRIEEPPFIPAGPIAPVEQHVEVAMYMREDLNEARLRVQRGSLEIVKTRNGLLPRLDLFVTLGKTGFADSFAGSVSSITRQAYDASAALQVDYPLGNRQAEAQYKASLLSRDQSLRAVENLASLVQVDVRTAYVEVQRSQEQITATAATRVLQQEKLRAEQQKLLVGKSTTLLVAQAERDLVQAQINEVQAVVSYLKSLVELYRLEGSLIQRRNIAAPGAQPTLLVDAAK